MLTIISLHKSSHASRPSVRSDSPGQIRAMTYGIRAAKQRSGRLPRFVLGIPDDARITVGVTTPASDLLSVVTGARRPIDAGAAVTW